AINVLNKRKEEAQVQLSLADEKLEELDNLLKKSRALREQITVVENLIGRRQHFSRALRQLPSLTPAHISIRNLSIRSGRLIIDGSAPDASYFPAFLNNLRQLEEFPEAELRYVNKNEAFGIDYQIVCKPKPQPQQETETTVKP
ncbi:MAG TPA: hypothetical protein EYP14_12390, partial [Planctomycetaceae bacterium]|nr:hypothetical protein [Planctomycetaceae bacterium]